MTTEEQIAEQIQQLEVDPKLPKWVLVKRSDLRKGLLAAGLIGFLSGATFTFAVTAKPKGVKVIGRKQ